MNDQRSFERFVADNVAGDTGGDPMPEDFYHDMHTYASHHRQRPEWLALIKEPPMRTNSRLAVGSPTARVAAIMVAALLLALTLAAAGFAGSRILAADGAIVVDQSGAGDYTTINEAVAAAEDGDEILVKPGVYPESIVIDKDITLLGEDRDSVIIELSEGCTIDEGSDEQTCPDGTPMVVREWSPSYSEESPFGIHLKDTGAEVGKLTLHDHLQGYAIFGYGGAPLIHDIKVTMANPPQGGYVLFRGASAPTVRDSELSDLSLDELSPATVTGNVIREIGVNTDSVGGEAVIKDNVLGYVTLGGPVTVEGNEFPASMASEDGTIGIFVERGGGWVIKDNTITGRQTAIRALSDGVIEGNGVGLDYTGDAPAMSGNRICNNSFGNVRADGTGSLPPDASTNEICPDE